LAGLATEIEMKDQSHDDATVDLFKEAPAFAAEYINQLFQGGEPAVLMVAFVLSPRKRNLTLASSITHCRHRAT
jgi:DNA-binding phage protein